MIDDRELELLIQEVANYHGYDFSGYSRASLKRRVERILLLDGHRSFHDLLSRVRQDEVYLARLVEEVTVNVTEMFRDPGFYRLLRQHILPTLGTKPFLRIWHAGCSTGEEVYSMAIVLHELGLLDKTLLYATDLNAHVLEIAREGVFPLRTMVQYSENYRLAGGVSDFSDYYTANYGLAKFQESLSTRMVFSQHNLVSDGSFNEFDLILCRNVLIYFDKDLQDRALTLFDESLSRLGYLALGSKETIKFSPLKPRYEQFQKEKIWKKLQ
ncbi:MAG TPA: protein-glutamate O-methyltransferase CheR [Flavobacterium sp.]|nr:protein-glutamate O-methyltransferase CheR [Flavobacterium sp.]